VRLLLGLMALTAARAPAATALLHDAGATSGFRWLDVADQAYSRFFQTNYDYGNPEVAVGVDYPAVADVFAGTLTAAGLKPNFAYQIKIEGSPGARLDNERVGLAGRWWQEQWLTDHWGNGANLNLQPDPDPAYAYPNRNPNDMTYFVRRDLTDASGHLAYRYTGYVVLGYFVTDAEGAATVPFRLDNSYHVLWKTQQRMRDPERDGPLLQAPLDAASSYHPLAYERAGATTTVSVFGEWERLPRGAVVLPPGEYEVRFVLAEESFHATSVLGGRWARALEADLHFVCAGPPPPAPQATLADGSYRAAVDAQAAAAGRGLWDISGHYEASVGGYPLRLDLIQDRRGRIRGAGSLAVASSLIPLAVKGTLEGEDGAVSVVLRATGSGHLLWSAVPAMADLRLALAVDAVTRMLSGAATLRLEAGADSAASSSPCILRLPPGTDGSFGLRLDLAFAGRTARGTAALRLASGTVYPLRVERSRVRGTAVDLVLVGDPADPAARGLRLAPSMVLLDDGSARIESLAVEALGQRLAW
jgi:hypothetical protein